MKNSISTFALSIGLLLGANICSAQDIPPRIPLSEQRLNQAATDTQWLKLLHYHDGVSDVISKEFFFSPNGSDQADSELTATLSAFQADPLNNICRFPARYLWLQKQLDQPFDFKLEQCSELQKWRNNNQTESVSLVFVTGYLGNPASFFGHLMLKFNRSGEQSLTPLLDTGISFGAEPEEGDNPIKYVTYGMFGGYTASFSKGEYYRHQYNYAEDEQRELWEYQLNLDEEEILLLEAHLWELLDMDYQYYFLNANCATQMAHFIGLVLDEPLLLEYQPWDMPIDLIHAITTIEHQGQPLVKELTLRESKYNRIFNKYMALKSHERTTTKLLVEDISVLDQPEFQLLATSSQKKIIALLFDYYELLIQESDGDELIKNKRKKHQLILIRLKLSNSEPTWPTKEKTPPHLAQLPKKIGVATGYNQELNWIGEISGQIAYYDFLALEAARFKDSNVTLLDTSIKFNRHNIWLNKLDFFNISTLNILQVDLFEDSQFAWSSKLSLEQESLACQKCEQLRWYGNLGEAIKVGDFLSLYALPGVQVNLSNYRRSDLQLRLGALFTNNDVWKTHIQITPRFDNDQNPIKFSWENRWGNARDWDIRLNVHYDDAWESTVGANFYF